MESPQDVGEVLLLRVHKAPLLLPAPIGPLSRDAWFCRWFQLTPPQGVPLRFPCYQWLDGAVSLALRAGPGEPGRRGGPGGGERQGRGKAGRCGPWGGERAAHCGSKGPGAGARGGGGAVLFLCPHHPFLCAHSQGLRGRRPPHPPATAPGRAAGQAGLLPVRSGMLWGAGVGWGVTQGMWGSPGCAGLTLTEVPSSPLRGQLQHPGAC